MSSILHIRELLHSAYPTWRWEIPNWFDGFPISMPIWFVDVPCHVWSPFYPNDDKYIPIYILIIYIYIYIHMHIWCMYVYVYVYICIYYTYIYICAGPQIYPYISPSYFMTFPWPSHDGEWSKPRIEQVRDGEAGHAMPHPGWIVAPMPTSFLANLMKSCMEVVDCYKYIAWIMLNI